MEGDPAQRRRHLVERPLEILLPEKASIRQPRPDYLLVACDNGRAAILGLEVGHQQKTIAELFGPGIPQRKTLLVRPERGDDHLGRHLEKLLVEMAHQHDRPFRKSSILGQQPGILDEL